MSPTGCSVRLAGGEMLQAAAVVCALPVGVLADVAIEGVAPERLASLRAQRNALVAKVVTVYDRSIWADVGANGLSEGEGVIASTWPQRDGCSRRSCRPSGSGFCSPSRRATGRHLVHDELERMYGPAARASRPCTCGSGGPIRSRAAT